MLHAAEKELCGRNSRTERRTFNERPSKLETVNDLFFQVIFCDFSNSLLGQFPALLVRDGHAGERRRTQSCNRGRGHDRIAQLRRNGRVSPSSVRIRPEVIIFRQSHTSLRRCQRRAGEQGHYCKNNCNCSQKARYCQELCANTTASLMKLVRRRPNRPRACSAWLPVSGPPVVRQGWRSHLRSP